MTVERSEPSTIRCPFCTAALSPGSVYCPYCKKSTTTSGAAATPAAPPPLSTSQSAIVVVVILVLLGILWALYSTYLADPRRDPPVSQTTPTPTDSSTASNPAAASQSASKPGKPPLPEAMRAYFAELLPNIEGVGKGIMLLGDASTEASTNPGALTDKDWQTKAALACVTLSVSGDRLRAIDSVPDECKGLNEKVRRIGQLSSSVASGFARGVDHRNNDDLNEAALHLKELGEVTASANAELAEIRSHFTVGETGK